MPQKLPHYWDPTLTELERDRSYDKWMMDVILGFDRAIWYWIEEQKFDIAIAGL